MGAIRADERDDDEAGAAGEVGFFDVNRRDPKAEFHQR